MATLDDILAELRGLRAEVAELRAKVADPTLRGVTLLARHLGAVQAKGGKASGGSDHAPPAPDDVLDAPGGDPAVKFEVKKWTKEGGEPHVGDALSKCPPAYLDLYAGAMEQGAVDPAKAKFRDENLRIASLARGWAARLRKLAKEAPPSGPPAEDEEGLT